MRGLQERRNAGVKYLIVKHNTICQESKVPLEGFEPVETPDKETGAVTTRYIKSYDRVEALITKIQWSEREWRGKIFRGWRISLNAAGVPCVLELQNKSRVANRFLKLAENIDFSRPVEFAAWEDRTTGNTAFMVGQRENEDDEKAASVPQKYTRENPGDCPEPKQRMGGKEWDWGDQEDFLYERMINVVIPAVEAAQAGREFQSEDAERSASPEPESAPATPEAPLDREGLVRNVLTLCGQLNDAGDDVKWSSSTLKTFVNDTYQVEDGLESLSADYVGKLRTVLTKRLSDLEVPF